MLRSGEIEKAERTIYLVNPSTTGPNLVLGSRSWGAPMGLAVAGSQADRIREEVGFTEREVGIRVVDENLGQHISLNAGDLVLISAFSLHAKRTQVLTKEALAQGAFVVVGGIHATVVPEDFTKVGAISFKGEAGNSRVYGDLIRQWLNEGVLHQGVEIASEGLDNPTVISLAGLPVSERVYRKLDERKFIHGTFAVSGCPYDCDFCTVMGGRRVRTRPVEEVVEEIKLRGLDKRGFTLADSNLGAAGMGYLHKLLDAFAQLRNPYAWNSEISVNLLGKGGNELVRRLKEAQCHRLFVGIESPSAENLRSVGKRHNLVYDVDRVQGIVENAHQHGIKLTGLFIVGFLGDTVASIRSIEDYINYTQLDGANVSLLTPLPGTRIWNEFANGGLFDPQTLDTDKLDLRHLLFQHPLGNDVILKEYQRLCKRVFSASAVLSRSAREFVMSLRHHLPESFERALRNSFGTEIFGAVLHRDPGMIGWVNQFVRIVDRPTA